MATNDTVQPAQQAPGVFDSILGAIVAGVEVYRNETEEKYNEAVIASNPAAAFNQKNILLLGLLAVGLYLAFKN